MKKCSNCFYLKPDEEFYPRKGKGLQSRCKECNREVCAGYRERAKLGEVKRYKTKYRKGLI